MCKLFSYSFNMSTNYEENEWEERERERERVFLSMQLYLSKSVDDFFVQTTGSNSAESVRAEITKRVRNIKGSE